MLKNKYFVKFCQGFCFLSGALFCSFIAFFALKHFVGWNRIESFKNSFFIAPQLSGKEMEKIKDLIEAGKVISFDSLFTQTLAYYDTIITVLIGVLGIFVAGSFIYIKVGSEEKNKEHAKQHIDSFLKTKAFHDSIKKDISNKVNEWGEDISGEFDKIGKLEKRVFSLEESAKKGADETIGEQKNGDDLS